jgi:diguanylate cyclase
VLEAQHGIRATISIGIAAFDPQDADHAAWIARADRALYRAKAAGRNRTVSYDSAER